MIRRNGTLDASTLDGTVFVSSGWLVGFECLQPLLALLRLLSSWQLAGSAALAGTAAAAACKVFDFVLLPPPACLCSACGYANPREQGVAGGAGGDLLS